MCFSILKGVFKLELAGLVASLIVVIVIVSKWKKVPAALTAGIFVLVVLTSIDLNSFIKILFDVSTSYDTLELVCIVLLITLLSNVMKNASLLKGMLSSLINLLKNIPLLITLVPAFVGLLAMPGGSIMSAPMVKQMGDRIKMTPGAMSAANVFFRHITLFFNPLSPMFIIIADLSGLGFMPIIKFHILPVIVSIIIGVLIINHYWTAKYKVVEENYKLTELKNLLYAGSPLIISLTLALLFAVNFIIALSLGIFLAIILDANTQKEWNWPRIKEYLMKGINWNMGITVYAILVFSAFVQNSQGIITLAEYFSNFNFPIIILILLSALIVGFASGHPMAGAAIVYPVFLPLVGTGAESVAYLSLLYTGMISGYLFSPIHLCLIVSNEYFKVSFTESYPLLLTLIASLLIPATLIAFFI